jgi:hypothetical protein
MAKNKKTKEESKKPLDILEQYHLNLQQEMFCQYFTSPTEFYGSGVQSYASAYNFDITNATSYNSAKSAAARLLTNVNVLARINSLLDISGFNDVHVDKQLLLLITQGADFNSKLGAIREYNKLKSRVTEKLDLTSGNMPITTINIFPVPPRAEVAEEEKQNNDNNGITNTDTEHSTAN